MLAFAVACSSQPTMKRPDLICEALHADGLGSSACNIWWYECDDGLTYQVFCGVGSSPQCSCYIDGGLAGESDANACAAEQDGGPSLLTVINDTCGWCIDITCPKR
jgi:hypothetical protein